MTIRAQSNFQKTWDWLHGFTCLDELAELYSDATAKRFVEEGKVMKTPIYFFHTNDQSF